MGVQGRSRRASPLLSQLRWFIRLRWLAGGTVISGALVNGQWLQWFSESERLAALGVVILAYNVVLHFLVHRASVQMRHGDAPPPSSTWLVMISWLQLLLDLGCLTVLLVWTRGVYSPFLGFYVFHMVFSSLLLPRRMAYGAAMAAIGMVSGGLALTYQWPAELQATLIGAGWAVTLLLTVYLTNKITRSLHRQRRGLARQRDRILAMSRQLKDQQKAMIQHEKMVALGQMAAGVAHEITNPLASADSLLELMQRLKQILQQMTAFAHPGETRGRLMDVNQTVEAALSMVRFDHRLRRVQIERQFSEDAGAVQVESQAIEQVIVNLVLNALDAMEDTPSPHLKLRTACQGDGCLIEVADNGHGIAPELIDHIFEPFFTTKPVGKGTGLGLAISYGLVRKFGGRIDLHTEVGKGTSFTISWPIATMMSYSLARRVAWGLHGSR
jgi:signal transduction histidine kinase